MTEVEKTAFRQLSGRTTVEWEIKGFKNHPFGNGVEMRSPTFWVSNSNWQLSLYPKGNTSALTGYVSLYLYMLSKNYPVKVMFTLLIKVNNSVIKKINSEDTFDEDINNWGLISFAERSKILECLKPETSNDNITVVCSIRIQNSIKEVSTQTLSSYRSDEILKKNLEDLFASEQYSDVKIKVGKKDFSAHKAILATRSPVFSSMFEHEMTERLDDTVHIIDCDCECFELFLKFLYTGNIEEIIIATSLSLYRIADKYLIKDLKEICCNFISESLEIDSICDVLELAIAQEEKELLQKAVDFFTENATEIFVTEKWQNFIREKSSLAAEILKQMATRASISVKPKTPEE